MITLCAYRLTTEKRNPHSAESAGGSSQVTLTDLGSHCPSGTQTPAVYATATATVTGGPFLHTLNQLPLILENYLLNEILLRW